MNAGITQSTKIAIIERNWHLIDAKDAMVGRVSVKIAHLLMGKSKKYFVRNLDCGDFVVVVNAKQVKIGGKKSTQKVYYRHSGYPGGLRAERFEELIIRRPGEVIRHAVKGMLPQNKLRDQMLKRLYVYADETHSYKDKVKKITV